MLAKDALKKEFAKDWKKQYKVKLFTDLGFTRRTCPKCDINFWSLKEGQILCGTPPCDSYGFIGKPITKKKLDYIQAWKLFERFFAKNGHASIKRYPVIDRWRPDLYFTIASIQDFQRIDKGNMVFEYPADPLVVPQVCLRFVDLPNVGRTGRHHTSFIMGGQHAFGSYWKDRTIELNFEFLTREMGIPEEELVYTEDVWAMHDFSCFGPCLETFSKGLELCNSVFSQYTASGKGYKELNLKVVDVGWGHERLVWFSQGNPTSYDANFGPVTEWMKRQAGVRESKLYERFAVFAGNLDFENVKDMEKARIELAKKLSVDSEELGRTIGIMQAIYAIADHAKTLLFAIADGGIPSNSGGGYNLRVILRRALSFAQEYGFSLDFAKIGEHHAKFLKPLFPELSESLETYSRVLDIEKKRYRATLEKANSMIDKELKRGRIDEKSLITLYTSHGIAVELVEKAAKERKLDLKIPEDFYTKITQAHMVGPKGYEKESPLKINIEGLPETKLLYYENPYKVEFEADIVKRIGDLVILDKTCFYPEGGGQPSDAGTLRTDSSQAEIMDVQKIGNVIVHRVKGPIPPSGHVSGKIDWTRRYQLMKMHTATHLIAGATRSVMGKHIWQAGAAKGLETSRLDMSHFQAFTLEDIERIEKKANEIIKKGLHVKIDFFDRNHAETTYGFILYQGGASPGKTVRVVQLPGLDVEACGGTHVMDVKEIGRVKIIKTERIQDGVNRLEFTAGDKASEFLRKEELIYSKSLDSAAVLFPKLVEKIRKSPADIHKQLVMVSEYFSVEREKLPETVEKFVKAIQSNKDKIQKLSKETGLKIQTHQKGENLVHLSRLVFETWKKQEKFAEKTIKILAEVEAKEMIEKASKGRIFAVLQKDRKELIELANQLMAKEPGLTVILANDAGEIIGMSRKVDMGKEIAELTRKAGGSGGGNKNFGQGKADVEKLKGIMKDYED